MKGIPCLLMLFVTSLLQAQPLDIIWDRSGLQDSSGYGYEILPLGDQNDDGFNDWAVWAVGHGSDAAYVEFFHGDSTSPSLPYLFYQDMVGSGSWIWWAGITGDLNGDSYTDWYLERRYSAGFMLHLVYWGGPNADTTADLTMTTSWTDFFLRPLGDFNGDGFGDLCLYHYIPDYAEIFYGGSPMDTIPDWSRHSPDNYGQQSFYIAAGDLNGDGYSDFVSRTYPLPCTTHIFAGATNPDTLPAFTWESLDNCPRGIVKDLNGDNYDDLVYGPAEHGEIYLGDSVLNPTVDVFLNFPCSGGGPTSVISAGDFNQDYYEDFILLNEGACLNANWGMLSLYLGHPWIYPNPAFSLYGGGSLVGIWTAAGLGDVNGDSIDDLGVGVYTDDRTDGLRGRAIIIAGDAGWIADADDSYPEIPQELHVSIFPNPFNSSTTIELSLPLSSSPLELILYNTLGQVVYHETLVPTSTHLKHSISAEGLASGVYVLSCKAGDYAATKKLLLMK